jgi:nucleoside-diphosphate-sugar epimerase
VWTRATSAPPKWKRCSGDPSKAKAKLGWVPATSFAELVTEMVEADYTSAKRDSWSSWPGSRPTTTTSDRGMQPDSRIYIAGHRGLVGSAIVRRLQAAGHTSSSRARTPNWT